MNDAEPPGPGGLGDRTDRTDRTDAGGAARAWPSGGHSIHELGHPDITELELGRTTHKVAEVQPMDLDGVTTMSVGTAIWAIAAVVLFVMRDGTAEHDTWLWTALAGCVLGIAGIVYCRRRRVALNAKRAQSSSGETESPGDTGDSGETGASGGTGTDGSRS